jgi:hypothetical protein
MPVKFFITATQNMRLSQQHKGLSHLITHKGAATTESQGPAFVSAAQQSLLATYEPTA